MASKLFNGKEMLPSEAVKLVLEEFNITEELARSLVNYYWSEAININNLIFKISDHIGQFAKNLHNPKKGELKFTEGEKKEFATIKQWTRTLRIWDKDGVYFLEFKVSSDTFLRIPPSPQGMIPCTLISLILEAMGVQHVEYISSSDSPT